MKSLGEGSRMVMCLDSAVLMAWAWVGVGVLSGKLLGFVSGTVKSIVS